MPALIIIVGLAGLILIIGGYAIQEISRPYPEERDAKRKSRMEAERLRRHAERDAIMAHAEIIDQRTKAELKRQYMRDQYPPGVPIPDVPMPDLPPDPREHMDETVQADPNLRHRIARQEPEPTGETPAGPDTRDLRAALRARAAQPEQDGPSAETEAIDRSANLKSALSGISEEPDGPADDPGQPEEPSTRASIIRANIARQEHAKKANPFRRKKPEPVHEDPVETADAGQDEESGAPEPKTRRSLFDRKKKPARGLFGRKAKPEEDSLLPEDEDQDGDVRTTDEPGPGQVQPEPADSPLSLEADDDIPDLEEHEGSQATLEDDDGIPDLEEHEDEAPVTAGDGPIAPVYDPHASTDPYADFMSDPFAPMGREPAAGYEPEPIRNDPDQTDGPDDGLIPMDDEPEELPEELENDELEGDDGLEPVEDAEDGPSQNEEPEGPDDDIEPAEEPAPRKGLFGRRPKPAKPAKADRPKRGFFGKKKQPEPESPDDGDPDGETEPAQAKPGLGLFGRKDKPAKPAGPVPVSSDDDVPSRSVNDFLEDDDLPAEPEAEEQDDTGDDDIYGDPDEELGPADDDVHARKRRFLPFGRK